MPEEPLFEEACDSVAVTEDTLENLAGLCKKLRAFESELDDLETAVKEKKRDIEDVSRNLVPSLLNNVGLSELRLATGEKVIVEDKIKASISNKNQTLAYRSILEAEGGNEAAAEMVDDLFKSRIIIEDYSDETMDLLLDKEIVYQSERRIHPQTLKKYCRECLENGKEIPEGISVFQYQETKIK